MSWTRETAAGPTRCCGAPGPRAARSPDWAYSSNDCLAGRHAPPVEPADDLSWIPSTVRGAPDLRAVTACRSTARREQLDPYAAPPARLFATAPDRETATFFDLSGGNRVRIAGVTVAVLLTTMAVTFVAGTRMVCPLRRGPRIRTTAITAPT
ncbi:hypothetical protein [Streptomyces pseudovenezuelae]|uniref:hypothetical protein n=1 Tax=Streptomyces pseudovenezuelae TaxID=67350 RepID=UPI0036E4F168